MKRSNRTRLFLAALCLCSYAANPRAIAQTAGNATPAANSSALPTFRVNTHEVLLDIVVTDARGKIVTDLKRNDFRIFEDRTEQKIRSFSSPAEHKTDADVPEVHSTADLAKIGDSPVTILVLDELNTRFEDMAYGRNSMITYLKHQPARLTQPAMLLVVKDSKFDSIHDFTEDRDALIETVQHHFPAIPFRMNKKSATDSTERMVMGLDALTQIAQASKGTTGRKNIIWVGVGFPQVAIDPVSMESSDAEAIMNAVKQVTQVMTDARVTLNVIDPTMMDTSTVDTSNPDLVTPEMLLTLTSESGTPLFEDGVEFSALAHSTGGFAYALRNDVDREIATAVQNGTTYYTLAYSPSNTSSDPAAFRKIHVFLSRPGLKATTREGYYPVQTVGPDGRPIAPTTHQLAFDLVNAGRSSIIYTGVHVEAYPAPKGYALKIDPKDLSYWSHLDGKRTAEVVVMTVCFGDKDKVLYSNPTDFVTPEPPESTNKLSFAVPFAPPSGTKRIRFVARDTVSGHIGTADVQLVAASADKGRKK